MIRIAVVIPATSLLLSGCASYKLARKYQAITSDKIRKDEEAKVRTITGDRRIVRQSKAENGDIKLCAETQADAIAAFGGKSSSSVSAGKATLSGSDEFLPILAITNARSPVSDVVRQIGWQLCNAQMNGWLGDSAYEKRFTALMDGAFLALRPPTTVIVKDEAAAKAVAR